MKVELDGKEIETTDTGFLIKIEDWNEDIAKVIAQQEGIELTEKQIITIFDKFKIVKVESLDANFDPNIHQAMLEIEDKNKEPGTVVQEIQKGFMMKGRLLRPSLVAVSKKPSLIIDVLKVFAGI